jgi:hypothetical protein
MNLDSRMRISGDQLYFTARRLGLRLHMRKRAGFYMRGLDVWFERQMSLPQQASMLSYCIQRAQKSIARGRRELKPLRKVSGRKKHNAA